MKSILHDSISEAEIAAALGDPRAALLPTLGSAEWARIGANPVAQSLIAPLRTLAEAEIDEPLPVLTDELYGDFAATGQRLPFEALYFERRRRFARAAICALLGPVGERDKWIRSLTAKLTDIFEEVSWSLPAHVAPENGTGKDPLMIDLFCAETANLMGDVITVFGDVLPPGVVANIRERLQTTIFDNYIETHERFVWVDITNNWNAVCHQGILGSALAVASAATCAKMLVLAAKYFPYYLSGYGDDGGCQEGPGYWNYGFGWFAVLNEQIETSSRGALSLFQGSAHIRQVSLYATHVALAGNHVVNFSDCETNCHFNPRTLQYLGDRLGESSLSKLANSEYAALIKRGIDPHAERTDFFYLARLLRDLPSESPADSTMEPGCTYFRDMQVLVSRSIDSGGRHWDFAAKGGHNSEHHNHNDCGSYIVNIDGVPLIIEIGSPEYTRAFFSPKRYENLAARTLGHSLPIVNGQEQAAGSEHAVNVISVQITENRVRFGLDLTRCYPPAANCSKLVRRFDLDTALGRLSVTDDYELTEEGAFETAIATYGDVSTQAATATIRSGAVAITVTAGEAVQFGPVETHGYSDHAGHPRTINRLVIKPVKTSRSGSVAYRLASGAAFK